MKTYWLNEKTGVLAACEQLDAAGKPIPGQEELPEDDARVQAILSPPDAAPDAGG